jgi:hypothetical protein
VSGANLTSLNATNITTGTLNNAQLPAAATTITSVGTLTGLAVSGTATVTASSGTAMRITNTGSGDSFLVEDSASPDSSPFVIDAAGNVGIGVSSPSTKLEVSGNVQILSGNFVVNGQGTFQNGSGQDGIILAPRIGGTGSYNSIFTPAILSASRTYTLPNVTGTMITTGNLSDITAVSATALTGTIASARISGSYTGITGVGTLAAGSIPATLLTGTTLPATIVTSSLTSVGTLTALTTSGQVTMSRGALGTTAGNELVFLDPNGTTSNGDKLDTRLIRNSNGTDWTTAIWRMGRLVDATRMGFIQFGDGAGSQDARLGVGSTTYATVNTSGLSIVGNVVTTGDFQINTASKNFIALNPTTGTGNAAQWLLVFGVYILIRNTSTRNDKENIQPLNNIVTPSMIDDIDISLWNRKGAEGFPEIGPMAEDMDDISPFLSIRGMDCDDEGNIVATDPTGINQNSWLSLLTLGIQDIRQRLQQLENP